MAQAFAGASGTGATLVYAVPSGYELSLHLLRFVLTCDGTAGVHKARVAFYDTTLNATTATLRDLNEAGPSEVVTYTYGVGLSASACVAVTGWEVTDALPFTTLAPGTRVTVAGVTDAGTTIAGDAVSSVTLFGDLATVADVTGGVDAVTLDRALLPG